VDNVASIAEPAGGMSHSDAAGHSCQHPPTPHSEGENEREQWCIQPSDKVLAIVD